MQIHLSIYCEVNFERAGCQDPVTARSMAARLAKGRGERGARRIRLIAQARTISQRRKRRIPDRPWTGRLWWNDQHTGAASFAIRFLFAILSFVHPPPNKVFLPAKRILSCSRLTTLLRIGLPHREYPSAIPFCVALNRSRFFLFFFSTNQAKWHHVAKPWIRKNCCCRDKFTFFFLIYRCPPATIYWPPPFPLFRPPDLCLLSPPIFISRVWSRKRWSHTGIGDAIPHEQAYVDRKYLIANRLEHASLKRKGAESRGR